MKLFLLLLNLICITYALEQQSEDSRVLELILSGEYEMLSENYKEANKLFLQALEIDSTSVSIYLSLAELSILENDIESCITHLNTAFSLDTTNIDIGLKLFEMSIASDQYENCDRVIQTLNHQYPDDVHVQNSLLGFYQATNKWENLIEYYCDKYLKDNSKKDFLRQAVEIGLSTGNETKLLEQISNLKDIFPLDSFVISIFVQVSYQQQQYELTKEGLESLIQLTEDNFGLKLQLAEVFLLLQKSKKSLEILDELYNEKSDNQLLLNLMTITLSELEDFDRLAQISKHYISLYPDSADGYENLTIAYMHQERYQDLLDISSMGAIKFPKNVTFPYFMGNTYLTLEDFESAKREFLKSLEISPENRIIRQSLLTVYEELEEYEVSDSLFKILFTEDKNDATNLNNYAYSLCERKSVSDTTLDYALTLAENAVKIEPDNSAFLDTIGWIYFRKKNYNLAIEYIKQSLSIDSTNSVILEHLGDVYLKLNDLDNGLKNYHKALKYSPGNQSVLNKIEQYE